MLSFFLEIFSDLYTRHVANDFPWFCRRPFSTETLSDQEKIHQIATKVNREHFGVYFSDRI